MKKITSLMLTLAMLLTMIPLVGMSAVSADETTWQTLISQTYEDDCTSTDMAAATKGSSEIIGGGGYMTLTPNGGSLFLAQTDVKSIASEQYSITFDMRAVSPNAGFVIEVNNTYFAGKSFSMMIAPGSFVSKDADGKFTIVDDAWYTYTIDIDMSKYEAITGAGADMQTVAAKFMTVSRVARGVTDAEVQVFPFKSDSAGITSGNPTACIRVGKLKSFGNPAKYTDGIAFATYAGQTRWANGCTTLNVSVYNEDTTRYQATEYQVDNVVISTPTSTVMSQTYDAGCAATDMTTALYGKGEIVGGGGKYISLTPGGADRIRLESTTTEIPGDKYELVFDMRAVSPNTGMLIEVNPSNYSDKAFSLLVTPGTFIGKDDEGKFTIVDDAWYTYTVSVDMTKYEALTSGSADMQTLAANFVTVSRVNRDTPDAEAEVIPFRADSSGLSSGNTVACIRAGGLKSFTNAAGASSGIAFGAYAALTRWTYGATTLNVSLYTADNSIYQATNYQFDNITVRYEAEQTVDPEPEPDEPGCEHVAGDAVIENKTAATCTADGKYDSVVKCTLCGEEMSRTTVTEKATGHNYTDGTCTVCGEEDPNALAPITNIFMQLGGDITQRNYTWFSTSTETGYITIAKASDMVDGAFPADATKVAATRDVTSYTFRDGVTYAFKEGYVNNKATVTDLVPGETYCYQLSNGTDKSKIYTFTIGEATNEFSFAFITDTQLKGDGSTLQSNKDRWSATLGHLTDENGAFADIDFIVSAGDQINTETTKVDLAVNERQYDGYFEHDEIPTLAMTSLLGNHDNWSNGAHLAHFNEPNYIINTATGKPYGATYAYQTRNEAMLAADYWFTYNSVLFVALNTNTFYTQAGGNITDAVAKAGADEHIEFIDKVLELTKDNEDIKWKVIVYHQSPYGSSYHNNYTLDANGKYTARNEQYNLIQMREFLLPGIYERDFDVILSGHDHTYSRSHILSHKANLGDYSYYGDEAITPYANTSGNNFYTYADGTTTPSYIDWTDVNGRLHSRMQVSSKPISVTNPDGILHITGSSSALSGTTADFQHPATAVVLSGTTYSQAILVDVTDNTLKFTNYQLLNNGTQKVLDEFTIIRTAVTDITEAITSSMVAPTTATVTAPTDGWIEGENTFNVSCDNVCYVFVSNDSGATYERLIATANEGGGYDFTAELTAESKIVVRIFGDLNGNGALAANDVLRLKQVIKGKYTLDVIGEMMSDINGNGALAANDVLRLKQILKGKYGTW